MAAVTLSRNALERIARDATRKALEEAIRGRNGLAHLWSNVVLGEREQGRGYRVFELYVPDDRPETAIFLTRAVVDRSTGEVTVEVFLDNILSAAGKTQPKGKGIDF